jgi:nucleoside-diphosphate-sugar epimerase
MRLAITGEKGFIGSNLSKVIKLTGHEFISLLDAPELTQRLDTGEPCVFSNTEDEWSHALVNRSVDVLIHNAAVVGTDVVALNSTFSTLSNVTGTHTIARACNKSRIPVCYMGTTVIYDTQKYQDSVITETSDLNPKTFYGIQKLSAEQIIKHNCDDWMIIRPLFAFGGIGDMNSLIAKTLYAAHNDVSSLDMFLNPNKIKDYMHVTDFCIAVLTACELGLWNDDYNVAAETPYTAYEVVEMISRATDKDVAKLLKWNPQTDYLGNHVLSSRKFRSHSGWKPSLDLYTGIVESFKTIYFSDSAYNPLKHLEEAKERGIDLTEYY